MELKQIDKHKGIFIYIAVALYLFINNGINALSVWSEHTRSGEPSIQMWEPFAWEYTSAMSVLIIIPFMFAFFKRVPLNFNHIKKQFVLHVFASFVFTVLHIGLMVAQREVIYFLAQSDYNFGPIPREFWYEYRKDAWGYVLWLVVFNVVSAGYARLKGEASEIALNEDDAQSNCSTQMAPEHFLVKKLDKEFLIKVADIEWLESAGNYVNLHSQGRIYPLRATLGQLSERLAEKGFSRVHRSYTINHHVIDSISYQPSGDGEITLKTGKRLNLSRRYKDEFKKRLS